MTDNYDRYDRSDYSVANLLTFLQKAGDDKIILDTTASAKKAAANIVLNAKILGESEMADVRTFDVEYALKRFEEFYQNNEQPRYPAHTWQTYRSRVRSSVAMFKKYNQDPLQYPPRSYEPTPARRYNQLNHRDAVPKVTHKQSETNQTQDVKVSTFDLQILIRNKEHTITVLNIPKDIRNEDIKKISELLSIYSDE